jgi:hypothetical protein
MDIGSLLIFGSLFLLVGVFVSRPLFERSSTALSANEHRASSLLAERDRVLDSIRELDMDYAMGKISPEDYGDQRGGLLRRGAEILRQLDEMAPNIPLPETGHPPELDAGLLPQGFAAVASTPVSTLEFDYELENLVSARRQSRSIKAAGFCHRCGNPIHQKDRFCSRCGATV